MLVDVVQLRRKGLRLPPEEVRAAAPVRGLLCLDPTRPGYYRGQRNAPLLAMLLAPGEPRGLLDPLDNAKVAKISRGAMLIIGTQQEVLHRRIYVDHRQAWWVRPAPVAG